MESKKYKESEGTIITPELKDKCLEIFVKHCKPENCFSVNITPIKQELGIDFDSLNILLTIYREDGLVEEGYPRRGCESFSFLLKQKAVDFFNHGGYQNKQRLFLLSEQKLQLEVDKLQLEVSELQKQFPNNPIVERVLSITANIATILAFGVGK